MLRLHGNSHKISARSDQIEKKWAIGDGGGGVHIDPQCRIRLINEHNMVVAFRSHVLLLLPSFPASIKFILHYIH